MDQLDISVEAQGHIDAQISMCFYWGREAKCLDIGFLYFEMNDFPEKMAMGSMEFQAHANFIEFPHAFYQVGLM